MKKRIQLFAVILLLAAAGFAQQPQPVQPPPPPPIQAPAAETKISPEQAKELFRSVDEILQFVSKDTGLPIKHSVKRELASREQVQRFIEERIHKDEDAQRIQRSELVLKKFGLLPRDFDLRAFMVKLLREQVAGYYDPKKKTVYLLDWVQADAQKSVLAHELTHALQDQNFGLEKWIKSARDKHDKNPDLDADEREAARQAVAEGQGMVVLIDYLLAPTGQSVRESPHIVDAIKHGMLTEPQSPVFETAPLYLKRVLTFPYTYGLDFVRELLAKGGKEQAFAGVFHKPPQNTHDIIQPESYLAGESLPPMRLPDFKSATGGYEHYDSGGVGHLDVQVMIKEYAGDDASAKVSPQWRGGYYYAARKREVKPEALRAETLAVAYLSHWSSPQSAAEFANAYAASVEKRYPQAKKVGTVSGANPLAPLGVRAADHMTQPRRWTTEAGPVLIEPRGDMVLIIESFDENTAGKLREAAFAAIP